MYPNYTKHNHEFLGSTKLSDGHVHRFAGVTFEGIVVSNGRHRHRFRTNTDFFADHHHSISGITGLNISVSNGRHIHFVVLSRCQGDGVVDNFQSRGVKGAGFLATSNQEPRWKLSTTPSP